MNNVDFVAIKLILKCKFQCNKHLLKPLYKEMYGKNINVKYKCHIKQYFIIHALFDMF